jgi:hypothetical protein
VAGECFGGDCLVIVNLPLDSCTANVSPGAVLLALDAHTERASRHLGAGFPALRRVGCGIRLRGRASPALATSVGVTGSGGCVSASRPDLLDCEAISVAQGMSLDGLVSLGEGGVGCRRRRRAAGRSGASYW